jgi:hypothetical protein
LCLLAPLKPIAPLSAAFGVAVRCVDVATVAGRRRFLAHAAVGRWIWENRSVPQQTLWLWSAPPQKWDCPFLALGAFFLCANECWRRGVGTLYYLRFVALPFAWLWKLWVARGGSRILGTLVFAFAISCAAVRFQPRPELFSYSS